MALATTKSVRRGPGRDRSTQLKPECPKTSATAQGTPVESPGVLATEKVTKVPLGKIRAIVASTQRNVNA
jgi:hypothetical protein